MLKRKEERGGGEKKERERNYAFSIFSLPPTPGRVGKGGKEREGKGGEEGLGFFLATSWHFLFEKKEGEGKKGKKKKGKGSSALKTSITMIGPCADAETGGKKEREEEEAIYFPFNLF